MSEVTNSALNQQIYKVQTSDNILSQVARVMMVLMPRGLSIAGFSERGDLLMIKYNDYKKSLPQWIIDFFEHQFLNDELLSEPHKVVSVFVATDKAMIVPEILFKQQEAEKWLRKLYFVESNEIINTHHLREDRTYYMYAWPAAIKSVISRYFPKARVLPFATYQFYKPFKSESALQCCLTNDKGFATLYKNRELYWHQAFDYTNAEDVAFKLKHVARQFELNPADMVLQCTVTNRSLSSYISELAQYFPGLKDGTGSVVTNERTWVSNIYLLQQLYACGL